VRNVYKILVVGFDVPRGITTQKTSIDIILTAKPEGKRPLRRPRHKCEDNIKVDHRAWIRLAQDKKQWRRLLNTAMNLPFP
jgi:hypothetical protein